MAPLRASAGSECCAPLSGAVHVAQQPRALHAQLGFLRSLFGKDGRAPLAESALALRQTALHLAECCAPLSVILETFRAAVVVAGQSRHVLNALSSQAVGATKSRMALNARKSCDCAGSLKPGKPCQAMAADLSLA
jgi:hypothetical protein